MPKQTTLCVPATQPRSKEMTPMHRSYDIRRARLAAPVLGLVAVALAAAGSPARAGAFALKISAPPRVVVGQPTVVEVSGTVADLRYPYWLTVVSIQPKVTSCPANYYEGKQIANATGGSILVSTGRITPDSYGSFRTPVGIDPYLSGQVSICAYIHDGETVTLGTASLLLTIGPNGSGGGRPASIAPPQITRTSGVLSCSSGQWSNQPTGYAYAWFAGGRPVGRGPKLGTSAVRGKTV